MNINKNQNRRDFLISSGWKGIVTGFGFIRISMSEKNHVSGNIEKCPEKITCRDCYKMGVCEEDLAIETRKEVKRNNHTAKISKGANHG